VKDFHLVLVIYVQVWIIDQTKINLIFLFKIINQIFNRQTIQLIINHEQTMNYLVNNSEINMIGILIMVKKGEN
jgi:hypothetical protein